MMSETAPEAPMSEFGRVTGVFIDPKKAFTDIAARPRWWVPVVLLASLALVYTYLYSQRVGWDRLIQQTIESRQDLNAEQRARAVEMGSRFTSISAYVGSVVGVPITALVVAGALLLFFNALMDARLTFKRVFAVTCYAFLTGLVSTALAILVMYLKNPDDFNIRNPLAFNVGAFLDPQTMPKWLVSLGSSIDLFSFWTIVLLATGVTAAAHKLSFTKALAGVTSLWVVVVIIKVGWVSIFG